MATQTAAQSLLVPRSSAVLIWQFEAEKPDAATGASIRGTADVDALSVALPAIEKLASANAVVKFTV